MDKRTIAIQDEMTTCKHFTGIHKEICKMGISYKSVADYPKEAKDDPDTLPLQLPCLSSKYCRTSCDSREFYNLEEATQIYDERQDVIREFLENLSKGICPTHKTKVEREIQVGNCVYAEPCGCRLYQGKAKSMVQSANGRNNYERNN